jgi:DNA-binding phage protein
MFNFYGKIGESIMALKSFDELLCTVSKEQQELIEKELAIAVRIQDLITEQGITKRDLARKAGMKESQLSRILSGNTNLTLKTIVKLECALGASLAVVPQHTSATKHPLQRPKRSPSTTLQPA